MRGLRLLIVTASLELGRVLKQIVGRDNQLVIAAEANNAYVARDKIIECKPDVILMTNELPRMSGITFLAKLMPQYPLPTVMIASPSLESKAYEAGAVDFIPFDESRNNIKNAAGELSGQSICDRLKKAVYPDWDKLAVNSHAGSALKSNGKVRSVIAMGASTGGTEALATVLSGLHKDIPGIVMVQHMPEGFTQMYAQRLNNECEITVKEAQTGDIVRKGQALLAPGDKHLRLIKVNGVYQVECHAGPKVSGHCPSVDTLFSSVAKTAGRDAIGVLLTGMGRDGAQGLLEMKRAGALTIGQDEKTCVVYGMPKAAYDMGAVTWQVPLEQIAQKLYYILDKK